MRRSWIIMLILLSLLSLIGLGVVGFSNAQEQKEPDVQIPTTIAVEIGDVVQSVDAPGRLVGTREILLGMGASGPLMEILIEPGEYVEAGQLLARLGNEGALAAVVEFAQEACLAAERELQEIYDRAPLETSQAQMNLFKAQEEVQQALYKNLIQQEGNRASSGTLAAAEAKYALSIEEVKRAEEAFKKLSARPENDPLRATAQLHLAEAIQKRDAALRSLNWYTGHPTALQQSMLDAEIAIAEANYLLAEIAWERVKDGPDPDILSQAELKLASAEAQLDKAEAELAGVELYAPFAGVILEVNARPGDLLSAGEGFILLSDLTMVEVTATVIEEDYPQIQISHTVELFFDARPDVEIPGQVKCIVPQRLAGDRPLYAVYISFNPVPEGLVPGMTADASIITAIRENVLRLPKSLVRSRSDGTATIQVWKDDQIQERSIRVGLRGDSYVEILSGLQVGDLIISEFGS
jgi:multidrug efflux pump subunit AcrA (membrane-fusion protein)